VTDCLAFQQTIKKKDVQREVAEWMVYFQDFQFEAEHRAGDKLKQVNCLSRYSQIMSVTLEVTARIKKAQEKDEMIRAVAEIDLMKVSN